MRTDWVKKDTFELLLTALMPENSRVLRLAVATGLRIGDCLSLRTDVLRVTNRPTIKEQKTGKTRRIYIPKALHDELLRNAGRYFVFEGRIDPKKPRTRSAVYKDLKRVARLYRLDGAKIRENIAPHTARKIFAVEEYKQTKSLEKVQKKLNHSDKSVTLLYALADELSKK